MIAMLRGMVAAKHKSRLVVDVGGVGYAVFVPARLLTEAEGELLLHTSFIVRDDGVALYGFRTQEERDLFDVLISVSGVGPKMALGILSTLSVDNLRNAVVAERHENLTHVPGIGVKTAKKIVFDLRDKFISRDSVPITIYADDINSDVMDALIALGYSVVEAQTAIQALPNDAPDDVAERTRLALQQLG